MSVKLEDISLEFRGDIERSLDAIDSLLEADTDFYMQEVTFVDNILPMIADRSGKVDTTIWRAMVGSPTIGIKVYGKSKEDVLFEVPPLLKSYDIGIETDGRKISEIVNIAAMKRNVMSKLGDRYIKTFLTDKVKKNPPLIEDLLKLNKVMERYNLPKVFNFKESDKVNKVLSSTKDSIKITEYEDF